MKPLDRRHFFAFLRDFDSVSDQQQPAIDARQTGKDGKHRLCPNPRELIQFQAGAMEEVQYAVITGVGKPEGAQEAGDAQQIDSDRHSSDAGDKPQEASHSRASRSQGQGSLQPMDPEFHAGLQKRG